MSDIGPTGIWHESHLPYKTSGRLVRAILGVLPLPATVRDLGCGDGTYLAEFGEQGCRVSGIEGTPSACVAPYVCCADLTEPLELPPVDLTLCIEVGEHIPSDGTARLLDNIVRSVGRDLVLSWAVPEQPGHGHVNCQPNEVVIGWLTDRGLRHDAASTAQLRKDLADDDCWWFPDTLMVFHA